MSEDVISTRWRQCKNILCVRTDNMGDLIMSGPAFSALKESLGCRITLLASPTGAAIADFLPDIDEVITGNFPWVQGNDDSPEKSIDLLERLREKQFDGAVIFTVYSQTALPAAHYLYLAGIPLRLAYAHENPYHLLSDWAADEEPFQLIRHQVDRDLHLLCSIGIQAGSRRLALKHFPQPWSLPEKLRSWGITENKRFIILHPGVSEERRQYPIVYWKKILKQLVNELDVPVLITGSPGERALAGSVAAADASAINAAGQLSMAEWIALITRAAIVISVNTATVHIAAALQTPVLVLYAMTNPQHTPWKSPHAVLPFSVLQENKSRNPIIRYVDDHHYGGAYVPPPTPEEVLASMNKLIISAGRIPAGLS